MRTIAWDVDDVLNDLMGTWLSQAWLPAHPHCRLRYDGLSENPPHALLGISKADYLASLDDFRLSPAAAAMLPVAAVLQWFGEHGQRYAHVAVTAVPLRAAPASAAWVMRHFGRWIRSFHVVPSYREGEDLPVYHQSKGEALRQWATIDALVDDDRVNLSSAERLGIRTFCVPRPWNRAPGSLTEILNALTNLPGE